MAKKDKPKDKKGGPSGCTATQCPHTSSGHCSDPLCGNNLISCPMHGDGK